MDGAGFHSRMYVGRDYPQMTLIGRCRRCRQGRKVEAQPGHVPARTGRDRTWCPAGVPAFLISGAVYRAAEDAFQVGVQVPCGCGGSVFLRPLIGKVNSRRACDGRCTGATGPRCECACGGENHGNAWT